MAELACVPSSVTVWLAVIPDAWLVRQQPEQAWLDSFRRSLTVDELQRADRYLFSPPRVRFVLARWMLRQLLSEATGLPPESLRLERTANEKPYLETHAELHFNVSHSEQLIAIAISKGQPVGVDVEKIDLTRDWELIASHQLHVQEHGWLASRAKVNQVKAFYDLWTSKEAYLKGLGMGLGHPLNSFALLPGDDKWRVPRPEVDTARCWRVRNLDLRADYAAALAAPGNWQCVIKEFLLKASGQ